MQKYCSVVFWRFWNRKPRKEDVLRKIVTLRGRRKIDKASEEGAHLLFREVEPFTTVKGKFCVVRNKKTGLKTKIHDFRDNRADSSNYEIVTDWTYVYQEYHFPNEAAYVIPKDIKVGEIVFIEDLIENLTGYMHNQGGTKRLKGCKAIWNNNDLQLLHDPNVDCIRAVG
jgi:hypothetical protein